MGAASVACEPKCAPRSWGGFGESAYLQTSTSVRLSVHFFRADERACSLAVWACVVPPSVMQHAVLLGRDSWMRFSNHSCRSLPPRLQDHRIFDELELSYRAPTGVRAYAINPVALRGRFHLSDEPQLLAANLVHRIGSQAFTGTIWWTCFPSLTCPRRRNTSIESGRQVIPLAGVSNLDPGDILGVAHAPRMCVPLDALQQDGRPSGSFSAPPGVTPIIAVTASPLAAAAATALPSPALLKRLTPEQHASFLRVWERLPSHLRAVALDLRGPDWTPLAIEQLGDVLYNFGDVLPRPRRILVPAR